jgi:hypothetical protein
MMIVGKKGRNGVRTEYRAFVGLYCTLVQRIFLVDKYSAFTVLEQV